MYALNERPAWTEAEKLTNQSIMPKTPFPLTTKVSENCQMQDGKRQKSQTKS